MDKKDILSFPKIDLHRHLDGAVKPEVVIKLAKKFGVKLPTYDLETFRKIYQIVDVDGIDELLARFAWTVAVMRTPEGIREVAYQQVLDLARENIWYAELRFAPGYHSIYPAPYYKIPDYEAEPFRVMTTDEVVQETIRGIAKGHQKTGVVVNLILCIPRECRDQYGIQSAFEVAKIANRWRDYGVVAIDLACDEYTYPPEIYTEVFLSTLGTKLKRDPHAGEMGADKQRLKNIKTCINELCADGLGHAIPLFQSLELMRLVKTKRIRVERNPLGQLDTTGVDGTGIDLLLKEGILITINSDDPVLMQKSLTDNFAAVLDFYGWGEKEMQRLVLNSLNGAFFLNARQEEEVRCLFARKGLNLSQKCF